MHGRYDMTRRFRFEQTPEDAVTYRKWRNGMLLAYGSIVVFAFAVATGREALVAKSTAASRATDALHAVSVTSAQAHEAPQPFGAAHGAPDFSRSAQADAIR